MDDFEYELPEDAIAQVPAEPRDSARLLVAVDGAAHAVHRLVSDLPDLLRAGDLLVVNTTRVLPARLHLRKETGGAAEVLLLQPCGPGPDDWEALVRPGRRLPPGAVLAGSAGVPVVAVGVATDDPSVRRVRLIGDPWIDGEVPLPPYLRHGVSDPERYQTVYADRPGSVAAPTAGLHLTDEVIDRCRDNGVGFATVDLAVGLDTFRPVTVADPADHRIHTEGYRVPPATWDACRSARAAGGRVVAVGTTTVRALESVADTGRLEGRTSLFIRPPHRVQAVDLLMTNFHLPRSSLLLLVEAFAGPRWRDLYRTALDAGYRFLSFGDAMLLGNCNGAGEHEV
jgi:S-adenosylmethionine:tRNA ribosyltransferase-isomerase